MRRILFIATLLAASHGTALWLGSRRGVGEEAASTVAAAKAPSRGLTLQSLLEAARAGKKEAGEVAGDELDFEACIHAARDKIPAAADLRAILEAGTVDTEADLSPETVAALGLWLEREPAAAAHWLCNFYRDYGSCEFDDELTRYFQRGGTAQLQQFLDAEPQCREWLIGSAAAVFREGEGSRILQLAGALKNSEDRYELINRAFDGGSELAGHLAAIQGLLGRAEACEFLSSIGNGKYVDLLDEARGAGFPEQALRRFEEECQHNYVRIDRNNIDAVLNNPNRATNIQTAKDGWSNYSPLAARQVRTNADFILPILPPPPADDFPSDEFNRRSTSLDEGRATPREFASWLQSVMPAGPGVDGEIARMVLDRGLDADAQDTVAWFQETQPDWRTIVARSDVWRGVPPEIQLSLAEDFSGESPVTDTDHQSYLSAVESSYERWLSDDPEACLQSIGGLPPGPLKERLSNLGKEEEE